ncbi:MAG: regulatory protein RecX [Clostridia bacterium]|nr:regulatory protein RecX [Clostridia bacterium]
MPSNDLLYEAKVTAVKLMGKVSYTYRGLINKLIQKGYSEEISEEVAQHYKMLGYLDDADYAEKFIKDAVAFKFHGPKRIRNELILKGVDEFVIEDVLSKLDIDFDKVIKELALNRIDFSKLNDYKYRQKAIGFFIRKGFDFEYINNVFEYEDEL